ncbi:MAG: hypothetical protein E7292_00760 [Lachnospiraceae bacterium]|nr:hypothetical protein [Lachnospiraceae bacterium]
MRNLITKWVLLFLTIVMLGSVTGCTSRENTDASIKETSSRMSTSQSKETQVGENEVQETSQVPEMTEKDSLAVIQYGDTIQVLLTVSEQKGIVEELGESEIVVADTSKEFQPEYAPTEEVIARNVEKAIGKHVGDTFTLWYEGGDGRYAYEYTILEIMDKPADTVAYGDRIQTAYKERCKGVDIPEPYFESVGELELVVSVSDCYMDPFVMWYDRHNAEQNVAKVIGKGVGDTFKILTDASESSASREYTILGIDKTVEYGDRIRVACRQSCFMADGDETEIKHEAVELPVWSEKNTVNLEGYELSESVTRELYHELMGKQAGDSIYVADENMDVRMVYSMEVLDVYGQQEEASLDSKEFWLAEEEDVEYLYGTDGVLYYAVVYDAENKMMYEYFIGEDKVYRDFSYAYEKKYNEQGKLIWEYNGNFDNIYEYQYDSEGMLAEAKVTHSSEYVEHQYFNPDGSICKAEFHFDTGEVVEYLYESGIIRKAIRHEADGSRRITEFDEWGFWKVEEKEV